MLLRNAMSIDLTSVLLKQASWYYVAMATLFLAQMVTETISKRCAVYGETVSI